MLGRDVMTCNGEHAWATAKQSEDPNCDCWWQECLECSSFEELHECEYCYYERLDREDKEEYGGDY